MPRAFLYWIASALAAGLFSVPGIALIAGNPHFASDMALLGYPAYFSSLLGVFKVAAATAILVPGTPRLKEWAYAGMTLDVVGAIVSRLTVQGAGPALAVSAGIGLVVLASWALRPAGRRLGQVR